MCANVKSHTIRDLTAMLKKDKIHPEPSFHLGSDPNPNVLLSVHKKYMLSEVSKHKSLFTKPEMSSTLSRGAVLCLNYLESILNTPFYKVHLKTLIVEGIPSKLSLGFWRSINETKIIQTSVGFKWSFTPRSQGERHPKKNQFSDQIHWIHALQGHHHFPTEPSISS